MTSRSSRAFHVALFYWLPVLAYMVMVLYLSSRSRLPGGVVLMPPYDKIAHFAQYFVLGLLIGRASRASLPHARGARPWLLGMIVGLAVGAGDERLQASVPGRFCSTTDFLADAAGIAAAQWAVWFARGRARGARMASPAPE